MKVLIIPDVHLKPFMFKQAAELMERGIAKRAVCLMDIPDDWNKQFDISLYRKLMMQLSVLQKNIPIPPGATEIMI